MPAQAVLFDLDGTLVDSLQTVAEALVEVLPRHGFQSTVEALIPRIGPPVAVLAREMFGASTEVAERLNRDYLDAYYARYVDRTQPLDGADALLAHLHEAGMPLGIVTNKHEEGAHYIVRLLGWERWFGAIVGRDTAGAAKPDPAGVLHAAAMLGAVPAATAMVGDTEYDCRAARAAGLGTVIALLGVRDAAALRSEGATHVVQHLSEVAPIVLGWGAEQRAGSRSTR